jgi:arylsulfatase A-like enzyme
MPGDRPRVIVLVVDGLRPDAITAEDAPALAKLRSEGVEFTNSHSVVPTVTRVNAATLVTGCQPGTHGIVGNEMYVPAVEPARAFSTQDYRRLARLDEVTGGRLTFVPTLAERLRARGLRMAAISSGSTGSAWLLNPRAVSGVGALINGYFDPGKTVAYPPALSEAILKDFGPAPPKTGARYDAAVAWMQRVLRDHVLPALEPDVVFAWLTEPDHSQHALGIGSAPAREAIRHADREVAALLETLVPLGLSNSVNVIVASDHGFTVNTAGIDVVGELVGAGLKAARDSDDVILASSGQAVGLHVHGRDAERITRIVRFAQSREWGGVLFTAGRARGDAHGAIAGTFSLELVHAANAERAPDIMLTFPWTSADRGSGLRGTDLANVAAGGTPYASDHGSMSPWNVRNTLLAWGPHFKTQTRVRTPAGNVDVTPTILALLGLPMDGLDGRVLEEALGDGPDPERVEVETRTHVTAVGEYRAAIQLSTVAGRRYVDKSWRIR